MTAAQQARDLRKAAVLRIWSGRRCTYAEIARVVGCSTRTVERIVAEHVAQLAKTGGVS